MTTLDQQPKVSTSNGQHQQTASPNHAQSEPHQPSLNLKDLNGDGRPDRIMSLEQLIKQQQQQFVSATQPPPPPQPNPYQQPPVTQAPSSSTWLKAPTELQFPLHESPAQQWSNSNQPLDILNNDQIRRQYASHLQLPAPKQFDPRAISVYHQSNGVLPPQLTHESFDCRIRGSNEPFSPFYFLNPSLGCPQYLTNQSPPRVFAPQPPQPQPRYSPPIGRLTNRENQNSRFENSRIDEDDRVSQAPTRSPQLQPTLNPFNPDSSFGRLIRQNPTFNHFEVPRINRNEDEEEEGEEEERELRELRSWRDEEEDDEPARFLRRRGDEFSPRGSVAASYVQPVPVYTLVSGPGCVNSPMSTVQSSPAVSSAVASSQPSSQSSQPQQSQQNTGQQQSQAVPAQVKSSSSENVQQQQVSQQASSSDGSSSAHTTNGSSGGSSSHNNGQQQQASSSGGKTKETSGKLHSGDSSKSNQQRISEAQLLQAHAASLIAAYQ